MARPLEFRNQLRIRLSRLLVFGFRPALTLGQMGIDLCLISQIERERPMHLFKRQCQVRLDHALSRQALTKEIDERIERYPTIADSKGPLPPSLRILSPQVPSSLIAIIGLARCS